jgi:sporulation protein YlmC with PRC-barrel domain
VPSLLDVSRYEVFSARGKRVGKVGDVLFAPGTRSVIGLVVQRPRLLYLVDRKDRFVALDRVEFAEDRRVVVRDSNGAWDASAARRLGVSWDETVIWVGMPVLSESGVKLGLVRDGLFDADSGAISAMGLTGGLTADAAIGVIDLPGTLVRGFDGEAVRVSDEALAYETSGGAAAAAGRGSVVATKAAVEAAAKAALYGKAAVKVAGQSKAGKKAMGWLKSIKDDLVDAMGEPDEDKHPSEGPR